MKLKENFITHSSVDGTVLLAIGEETKNFHGIVKLNETASFIVEALKEDTTLEKIVSKMKKEYPDVDETVLSSDVREVLDQLESIHALIQ